MQFEIVIFISSVVSLIISAFYFRKNFIRLSLALLLLAGLLLRLYVALDPYLHFWDECFHALVAKHFIAHPLVPALYDEALLPYNYQQWFYSHIWLHKPQLPTWAMAVSMKLLGINEIALRAPSVILSTIAIGLTYFIGKFLFSEKVGWLAAFFQTINGFILEITGGRMATDHVDVFFFFFIELAIVFAILQRQTRNRVWIVPFILSLACAIYSKWLPALIVIPLWLILNFRKDESKSVLIQLMTICLSMIILVLPWQWYIFSKYPEIAAWESSYNWLHVASVLDGHDEPWYYFFVNATVIWSEAIWIATIWALFQLAKKKMTRELLLFTVWIGVPYLFFTIVRTKMPGYVLFTAPALFIALAYFWFDLNRVVHNNHLFKIPVLILQIAIIVLSLRYSAERVKPFQRNEKEIKITESIKELNRKFDDQPIVFFNTAYSIPIMFYTPFYSYDRIPTRADILILKKKEYKIMIFDSGDLPGELRSNRDVEIIASMER